MYILVNSIKTKKLFPACATMDCFLYFEYSIMNMARIKKTKLAFPARHPLTVIFLWLLIVGIVVSTNAPQLLNSQVKNEREFGEP